MLKIFHLLVGGAAGTISRYFVGGFIHRFCGTGFPYGTLVVNLFGCFIIGFLASAAEKKFILGSDVRTLLMVGFCGAFTTFSTFIFETDVLVRNGEILRALGNVILSIIFGFILFRVGAFAAEVL